MEQNMTDKQKQSERNNSQLDSTYLRVLFDTVDDGLLIVDAEGKFESANPAFFRIFDWPKEELIGEFFMKVIPPNLHDFMLERWNEVQRGEGKSYETVIVTKQGQCKNLLVSHVDARIADEKKYCVVIKDITERKRAEQALRESENKFKSIAEHAVDSIFIKDRDRKYTFVNRAMRDLLGLEKEQIIGKTPEAIFGTQQGSVITKIDDRTFSGHTVNDIKSLMINGKEMFFNTIQTPLTLKDGEVTSIMGVVRDVTKLMGAEQALRNSEQRYRNFLTHNVAGIWRLEYRKPMPLNLPHERQIEWILKDAVLVECNDKAAHMFGFENAQELKGKEYRQIFEHDEQTAREIIKEWIDRNYQFDGYEIELYNRSGDHRWYLIMSHPLIKNEHIIGSWGTMADLTDHRQAEEALKESEKRFRTLADQSPNMIFINRNGNVVYVNEKCEQVMGYAKDQFYADDFDFLTLIAPKDREMVQKKFSKHMTGEEVEPYEYTLITKNGQRLEAIITTKLIDYGSGKAILGIVTDITELKNLQTELLRHQDELEHLVAQRTEQLRQSNINLTEEIKKRAAYEKQIKKSEEKYRLLLDSLGLVVSLIDYNGTYLLVNKYAADCFRLKPEDFIGKTMWDFFPKEHADRQVHNIRSAIDGSQTRVFEAETIVNGIPRWYETVIQPVKDQFDCALIMAKDVTDKKTFEHQIHDYRQKIYDYQRYSYVNSMGSVLAHELNRPLTMINLLSSQTVEELEQLRPDSSQIRQYLEQILHESQNAAQIMSKIRNIARESHDADISKINIMQVAEKIISIFTKQAQRNRFSIMLDSQNPSVTVDYNESALEQMFFILIQNAIEAGLDDRPHQLKITIEAEDSSVTLVFADDGCGIDEAQIDKIFEPFFSTKPKTKSMGLGLDIVKRILMTFGGQINVESKVSKGTTFTITLPRNGEG